MVPGSIRNVYASCPVGARPKIINLKYIVFYKKAICTSFGNEPTVPTSACATRGFDPYFSVLVVNNCNEVAFPAVTY